MTERLPQFPRPWRIIRAHDGFRIRDAAGKSLAHVDIADPPGAAGLGQVDGLLVAQAIARLSRTLSETEARLAKLEAFVEAFDRLDKGTVADQAANTRALLAARAALKE